MNKKSVFVVGLIDGLIALAALVNAHGFGNKAYEQGSNMYGMGGMHAYHEEMEGIMEEGSYDALVSLRDELGVDVMPWINTQEEFEEMQERHEEMERFHEGSGRGHDMKGMSCH